MRLDWPCWTLTQHFNVLGMSHNSLHNFWLVTQFWLVKQLFLSEAKVTQTNLLSVIKCIDIVLIHYKAIHLIMLRYIELNLDHLALTNFQQLMIFSQFTSFPWLPANQTKFSIRIKKGYQISTVTTAIIKITKSCLKSHMLIMFYLSKCFINTNQLMCCIFHIQCNNTPHLSGLVWLEIPNNCPTIVWAHNLIH